MGYALVMSGNKAGTFDALLTLWHHHLLLSTLLDLGRASRLDLWAPLFQPLMRFHQTSALLPGAPLADAWSADGIMMLHVLISKEGSQQTF